MDEPRFLTIAQVADTLAVKEPTIRSLVKSGELRAFQIGGQGIWRIGHDDLDGYIDASYVRAQDAIIAGELDVEEDQ
ncbi:hypothetical protein GCM10027449_26270 [Sinomonas notoginsengisoli]|uniref:helix-turn-helix domain-containing protein n=1 Tax=Sinomonas notoginsengisoli TaxID=1457311 RepID=UPI001F164C9D|nr:helix-turn-helix domain-containing protein [Sinomonas notoginsengisoli]